MAPHDNNFAYNALSTVWYPTWKALNRSAGRSSAIVAIIFIGCTLNGFCCSCFCWTKAPRLARADRRAALQVFPITRYFYYNTHINLMDWFWLPVHLLIWSESAASEGGRTSRLIGWAAVQESPSGAVPDGPAVPDLVAFLLVPYGLLTSGARNAARPADRGGRDGAGRGGLLLWFVGPLRSIPSSMPR